MFKESDVLKEKSIMQIINGLKNENISLIEELNRLESLGHSIDNTNFPTETNKNELLRDNQFNEGYLLELDDQLTIFKQSNQKLRLLLNKISNHL